MSISIPRPRIHQAAATPRVAAEAVKYHLGEIAQLFDMPHLTLVIRSPTLEDDIIVGNDDLGLAKQAIDHAARQNSRQLIIRIN